MIDWVPTREFLEQRFIKRLSLIRVIVIAQPKREKSLVVPICGSHASCISLELNSPDTSKVLEDEMEVEVENAPVFALP
jgi:hypothetical protein